MPLGHRAINFQQAESDDPQAATFEPRENLGCDRALHRIGFEDHERSLAHDAISISRAGAAGAAIATRDERGPMAATNAWSGCR